MVDLSRYSSVYVDVDGTLLIWPGSDPGRMPLFGEHGYGQQPTINRELVEQLKKWKKSGPDNTLVIWSRNGTKHAFRAAAACELTADACLPKPDVAIDDSPQSVSPTDGRRGILIVEP